MLKLKTTFFLSFFMALNSYATTPKYIFYFIGDGMGQAEQKLASLYLKKPSLSMQNLKDLRFATTHSFDKPITDSAAAATALASGIKTNNYMVGLDPAGDELVTILDRALELKYKTGVITNTRLTHATPAAFLSHSIHRDFELEIAEQIIHSNIDFLAGGRLSYFRGTEDKTLPERLKEQSRKSFLGQETSEDFLSWQPQKDQMVMALLSNNHLPLEMDRAYLKTKVPKLSQIVEKSIEFFEVQESPFVLVVEGGRIDHCGHKNDLKCSIFETIDFDKSIEAAINFYHKNPNETLIIVTADHETGGLGLGYYNKEMNFAYLDRIKFSIEDVFLNQIGTMTVDEVIAFVRNDYGLDDMTKEEEKELYNAYIADFSLGIGPLKIRSQDSKFLRQLTHIIATRTNLFWTTFDHTGVDVPVHSMGVGLEHLKPFIDNTDIARALFEVLRY